MRKPESNSDVAQSDAASESPSLPSGPGNAATAATAPNAAGILKNVQRRNRRRGSAKPPGWVLKLVGLFRKGRQLLFVSLPAWCRANRQHVVTLFLSLVAHLVLAIVMGLWILPTDSGGTFFDLIATRVPSIDDDLEAIEIEEIVQPEKIQDLDVNSNLKQLLSDLTDGDTSKEMDDVLDRDFQLELEPTEAEMEEVFRTGEFGGRSTAGKTAALRKYGGTAESEKAVSLGLQWLKGIQQPDGSWNFQDQGPDAQAGAFQKTEVGATSLALLCFLGSGHTHVVEGPYKEVVEKGLAYIGSQAEIVQGNADLRGDSEGISGMYVQGLATICISEAHALDHRNKDLKKLTEMAVGFIEKSQHPFSGGWRYSPRSDDRDTSVTGWQIMALQSAKAGRIRVSSKSLRLAKDFLRDAQTDSSGAFYTYDPDKSRGRTKTMTAVGLLCRMYLGWQHDNPALKQGVEYLAKQGPDPNDIYYNYYATQVLRHWGGPEWKKWNQRLRERLVSTQIKKGPAAGSWRVTDPHGRTAGQIYQTALSLLTLEVYYRHLPIYRRLSADKSTDASE